MRWELVVLIVVMVGTGLGCLLPNSRLPTLPNDKLLHFMAFGGMALMAGRLVLPGWHMVMALGLVFLVGALIELLQNHVPGRRFCWRDMAANGAGIVSAGVVLALVPV